MDVFSYCAPVVAKEKIPHFASGFPILKEQPRDEVEQLKYIVLQNAFFFPSYNIWRTSDQLYPMGKNFKEFGMQSTRSLIIVTPRNTSIFGTALVCQKVREIQIFRNF